MVTIKEKTLITPKMTAQCPTHARTELANRDVTLIVDEPIARGGTNQGFTPTETFLASLVACTNVISRRCAHEVGVEFDDMSIDIEYDFDPRGARLKQEVDLPFLEVRMDIRATTAATPGQMQQIKTDLAKFCPVAKMFRKAGTNIVETWHVTPA